MMHLPRVVLPVFRPPLFTWRAGQGGSRYHRYEKPWPSREGLQGGAAMRLFRFGYAGSRCDRLLRKAIQIDTPDRVIGPIPTRAVGL